MRIKAILTGLLLGVAATVNAQVNVSADFGNWVEYPLVKKIGVYQTPLVTKASGWLQRGLPKLGQLEPRAFRYEYSWGKDEMYGVANGITGSASYPTCRFDDWDYLFDNVNTYTANSSSLIFAIGYTPTPLKQGGDYKNLPNNWVGWNETVHQFVRHWKDKGYRNDYVEVWNEPDLNGVFSNFNEGDYHNLYINTARSVRDVDQDIKVGGPAACFTGWFNSLVDISKNYNLALDFISGHAYTDGQLNNFVSSMRSALNRNGNKETEMLVTEFSPYNNNIGETHHDGPVEKYEAASSFFHSVKNIVEMTDLTYLTWAQYLDPMDMGSMNDASPHAITADWGDKMGLIDEGSGNPKALYYAFQLYGMMPADRYQLNLPNGLEGMASRDDNQVDVVLWKTSTGDQSFTLTMRNIPFTSGKLEVYHIDPIHNSYYEDHNKTSLRKSDSSRDNVQINNGTYTVSESILQKGVCFIRIINNDKKAAFPKNDFATLIRTHNWYPDRSNSSAYGQFDAKTWTAHLSTNSVNGWGVVGVTAENLPQFVKVTCKTDISKYITTGNQNATLNVRVDYANGSGGYDKAVVFHGGVYNDASSDIPQWGTKRAADEAVKVDNFSDFTFDLKKYAPANFSGRAIITFNLDNVGANAKADIQVSRGTSSTVSDQKGDDSSTTTPTQQLDDNELPTRSPKVYYGFMSKAPETGDPANYSKWDYTRNNVDGFYTNFIDMWQNEYQLGGGSKNCNLLAAAFKNHSCFFEATMEPKVNDDANGAINEQSDRRMIDELQGAGFSVDYASVNYMQTNNEGNCKSHIANLHNYNVKNGRRSVLYLCGPWGFGGNINNNGDAKTMASWTDGIATDGPLGYWYKDMGGMKNCSYSIVQYANQHNQESAIMLCPYSVEQSGYNPNTDFLRVSKDCVFGHEDHNAAPQVWTLWMYGGSEINNFAQFPECNAQGEPLCTATGVTYWLLKHLKTFPVLTATGAENKGNNTYNVNVAAGQSVTIPITLTNGNNRSIELSPVVRGILDTNSKNYNITFNINGRDVTNEVLHQGGLNFVNGYRLSSSNNVTLNAVITPRDGAAATSIQFQVMPNYTNTADKAILLTLNVNGNATVIPDTPTEGTTVLWSGSSDANNWNNTVTVEGSKLSNVKIGDKIEISGNAQGGAQIQVNDANWKALSSDYEDFTSGKYTLTVTADNIDRVKTGLIVKGQKYTLTSIKLVFANSGSTTPTMQNKNIWKGSFDPSNWDKWLTLEGSLFSSLNIGDKLQFVGSASVNAQIQINDNGWKKIVETSFASPYVLDVTADNINKIKSGLYIKGQNFTLSEVNIITKASSTDTPTKPETPGFHVSGTQILDSNGNPFIMRGVNYSYAWQSGNANSVIAAAKRQGFNTVRLNLSDGGRSGWKVLDAAGLESLINLCEQNKLIAVLNTHDESGSNSTSDLNRAVNYWKSVKDVLNKHKNTVIVNISNEWYGDWASKPWAEGYESAIPALRQAGIVNTLMVDCAGWGQYPQSIFDEGKNVFNSDPDKNTVFSIHMYEYAGKDDATVKSNIDKALALNVPVVIGEFGCSRGEGKDIAWQSILDYTKQKNVGWAAWSWTGNGGSDVVLNMFNGYDDSSITTVGSNIINGNNGVKATSQQCSVFGESADDDNYTLGDVNADGSIDIADAIEIVNALVGRVPADYHAKAADMNQDGSVNVADAVAISNYLLTDNAKAKAIASATDGGNDDEASLSLNKDVLTLNMTSGKPYTAFQFDVKLPDGASIENVALRSDRIANQMITFGQHEDGHYTVVAFSTTSLAFHNGGKALVDMQLSGYNGDVITVSDIHFVTTAAVDNVFTNMQIGSTNGINAVEDNAQTGSVDWNRPAYNLRGQRVSRSYHGVVIQNGKKFIIK